MRGAGLLLIGLLALAACKPFGAADGADSEQLPLVGQERVDAARFECIAHGGSWAARNGGFICQMRTKDAGKSCTSGNDCEGDCLARSRTCAPAKPLLGCNEILTEAGYPMQQCVE